MTRFNERKRRRQSSERWPGIGKRLRPSGPLMGRLQGLMGASRPSNRRHLDRSPEPGPSGSPFLPSSFLLWLFSEIIGDGVRLLQCRNPRRGPHRLHARLAAHRIYNQPPRLFQVALLIQQSLNNDTQQDRCLRTAVPRFDFERAGSSDTGFAASARLRQWSVSSGRSAKLCATCVLIR